jgi:hypothetical protein
MGDCSEGCRSVFPALAFSKKGRAWTQDLVVSDLVQGRGRQPVFAPGEEVQAVSDLPAGSSIWNWFTGRNLKA